MQRPFKFRICYTDQNGKKSIIYSDNNRFLIGLNGKVYENYGKDWKNPMWEEVFDSYEPPIIQQYTGLTDKNNVDIYEDDIVKWGDLNYLVEWNDIAYKWQGRCPYYHSYHHPTTEHFRDLMNGVIVGNSFENNDLLK